MVLDPKASEASHPSEARHALSEAKILVTANWRKETQKGGRPVGERKREGAPALMVLSGRKCFSQEAPNWSLVALVLRRRI